MDRRHVLNSWLSEAAFPVDNGKLGDPKTLSSFFLGQSQFKPLFLDMLAQSVGLKISFIWFQALKRDGHELQKSNASLRERHFEKLKARRRFIGREAS